MAIASKWLGARYNRPGAELFDFDTYAIAGDGCLMEGVSHEAASIAGHLKVDNLCWIYDNNHITIDGRTNLTYEDDVASRFLGYGWNVTRVEDANDTERIAAAFDEFKAEVDRPTLIIVDSHIGYGSPHKQDTPEAHGEPLGEEEVRLTKRAYGWPEDAKFLVPDGVQQHFADGIGKRGAELRTAWEEKLAAYAEDAPDLAAEIDAMQRRQLPEGWDADIPSFEADEEKGIATRKASNKVQNAIAARLPWLLAGSADLTDSTSVRLNFEKSAGAADASTQGEATDFEPGSYGGRQLHYGIREHESAAISNGLSLSKLRPLWSTYLTFSDYARPAIRLSSLMELPVIHLFTHDSIGLGEDGPTHQPVEQLAALRAIPNVYVMRPADAVECAECWEIALLSAKTPSILALTRQGVPLLRHAESKENLSARGAYVLIESEGPRDVTLIGTGSELMLAVEAAKALAKEGIKAAVVSMPCWELLAAQPEAYRDQVLGRAPRVAVEAAVEFGWERWLGAGGAFVGMHGFGASGPAQHLYKHFGITAEAVASAAKDVIGRKA
jgi:transketolase